MAPTKKSFKKREEFKARPWLPRGVHVTVYDIQGTAISEQLVEEIVSIIEEKVKKSGNSALAIDVRKS